jgi:ribosome-interacting GTPase 1
MPTNLPAEYYEVEERYKAAAAQDEKIRLLDELISTIPKHKGTDKLRADLRKRLSKLKSAAQGSKGTARHHSPYLIDKEGAGQVVVVGPANAGKSALVQALTNADPEVSPAPYSTWGPTPGMMLVRHVPIQLIDLPPLNPDYVEPAMMDLIRRADLILLLLDLQGYPIAQLEETLELLAAHRIFPLKQKPAVISDRRMVFKPILFVVNKNDDEETDADFDVLCELFEGECELLPVSAITTRHLNKLREAVLAELGVMRIFSKPPGEDPDFTAPFVMKTGSTLEDFAAQVHKDFVEHLKSARIWGSGAFDGQVVGRDHVLEDGDVVELKA